MPGRLSKLFSTDKEKEALAEATLGLSHDRAAEVQAPPPYQPDPASVDADNATNPPDLTAGFSNLQVLYDEHLPSTEACIAHLKVLEAFYRLKQNIGSTDGLFDIHDSVVMDLGFDDLVSAEMLTKLAEKRWSVYVARAVDRFGLWRKAFAPAKPESYTQLYQHGKKGKLITREYMQEHENGPGLDVMRIDQGSLPPIDILLVWHAYMLNPRAYLEDCLRMGRLYLWHHGFPFQAASNAIDSTTFVMNVSSEAKTGFASATGRNWDNVEDNGGKQFSCPGCFSTNTAQWTVPQSHLVTKPFNASQDQRYLEENAKKAIDSMLSDGGGYCDAKFSHPCVRCGVEISHEYLRMGKFWRDLRQLQASNVPMPGTLFGATGIPGAIGSQKDRDWKEIMLKTNKALADKLGDYLQDSMRRTDPKKTINHVRGVFESVVASKGRSYELRGSLTHSRAERITIRRMLSRYWNNSSNFALDLVGAVIRQGVFTEKMHNIDWLHAPSLPFTMQRLRVKYTRFVKIMSDPIHMAVPTLDVDLAWHTHQLMPHSYLCYTVSNTRQFIDHDDKVSEVRLNDAFAWTSKHYQRMYGEPYSECTCWYCEAIRESNTSPVSRVFNTSYNRANDMLPHDVDQDPSRSVHISAHNAVRPSDDRDYIVKASEKARQLEAAYEHACARAEKKGRKRPDRRDYYYSDAYGYPVYIPAYAPYVGPLPYTPCYYPVMPGCMAVGVGAVGNCAAGTCSATVSSGGCVSVGGGGCGSGAGASAGGCGSSGGCGGGGGGGGDGGGGGGGGGGCGGGGG